MKRLRRFLEYLEARLFIFLLKRYCTHYLDQWERWKLKTKYGDVYIQVNRDDDGYNWHEVK